MVPWVNLWSVIAAFPGHTKLLFFMNHIMCLIFITTLPEIKSQSSYPFVLPCLRPHCAIHKLMTTVPWYPNIFTCDFFLVNEKPYRHWREKTCLPLGLQTTKAQISLISTFVIHLLKSIISRLARSKISIFS